MFMYINLDKAKDYFIFIQTYVYKYMKFRHKNIFKIQTLLYDKPANYIVCNTIVVTSINIVHRQRSIIHTYVYNTLEALF